MKLQNEETGQVENFCIDKDQICSCDRAFVYDSLAQLQEAGWKDYKEPKEYWVVDYLECGVDKLSYDRDCPEMDDFNRQIGNYFETKEEAEKAVEKLKAWKRLKDKGLMIKKYTTKNNLISDTDEKLEFVMFAEINSEVLDSEDAMNDLKLLFRR